MMNANELLLLGLLCEGDRHGYELHEFLEKRLKFVSDLTRPTAYRMLDRLYTEGHLERVVERQGKRPERMRYTITDSGRDRFQLLLQEGLQSMDVVKYPGNIALFFEQRLPPAQSAKLLQRRIDTMASRLELLLGALDTHPDDVPGRPVLEHNIALLRAELEWLRGYVAKLEKVAPSPAPSDTRD